MVRSVIPLTDSGPNHVLIFGSICVSFDFCLRHNQEAQDNRGRLDFSRLLDPFSDAIMSGRPHAVVHLQFGRHDGSIGTLAVQLHEVERVEDCC
jgi:hypothetical protein